MNATYACKRLLLRFAVAAATTVAAVGVPADDASVLPAGVSRFYVDFYRYLPTTERYNPDGKREVLTFPFDDAVLDNTVLPLLPPGANIGRVAVDYEYDIDVLDFGYARGLSDRLSIGFHVPYYWIRNDVDTSFDSSNANVGLNPGDGSCCIPIASGGVAMNEDDVQNLIADQFGFSRIDSWSREGIGDIEAGAKYRLFIDGPAAMAITGGLRIPTGYEDDADRLDDVAWSYGTYAVLVRLHYDFLLSSLWRASRSTLDPVSPAPGDLILNLTLRYDWMLPDDKVMRIGDTPEQILTANRERVDRELGDLFNLEASLKYQASDALALSLVYTFVREQKDDIDGDLGFNYASLEADTDSTQQIVILALDYSSLPAYRRQQSAAPMRFSLAYRERFGGDGPRGGQANPILYTRWLVAGLELLI